MEIEKTFKTKTGFCHILSDKIILTRDGITGNVAKVVSGNNISRILIIYSAISIFLIYFLNKHAERDEERQRIQDQFKRKHGVANKVLDMIMKEGTVYKWIKANKGTIATTFNELFTDIAETLFDE